MLQVKAYGVGDGNVWLAFVQNCWAENDDFI